MKSPLKVIQLHKNREQLIKKAIKNDREAQHDLYNLFAPKMLSTCRFYISDLQYAEDVLLKGFFKVFKNLKSFKGHGNFEGWIRKIMVRECITFLRQHKHLEFSEEDIEINHIETSTINTELEVEEIQQLIDSLPEGYRVVFVMYAVEGYKHYEIAEILGISEGTSKSQLFKARKMLQQKVITLNKTSYGTN